MRYYLVAIIIFIAIGCYFYKKKIIENFPYVFWVNKRPALYRVDKYHYGVDPPLTRNYLYHQPSLNTMIQTTRYIRKKYLGQYLLLQYLRQKKMLYS